MGKTFWLINSSLSKVIDVRNNGFEGMKVFFIEPSVIGGSKDTKISSIVGSYSVNGKDWVNIEEGLSDITGRVNKGTNCLVLKSLTVYEDEIDLTEYRDIKGKYPLKFSLGASTALALKNERSVDYNKNRKVVAIGELTYPYSVFVSVNKI